MSWQTIDSAPRDRVVLTNEGTGRYVDPRQWASPVDRGWYLCSTDGDIPTCADDGMAVAEIDPTHWMPLPVLNSRQPNR